MTQENREPSPETAPAGVPPEVSQQQLAEESTVAQLRPEGADANFEPVTVRDRVRVGTEFVGRYRWPLVAGIGAAATAVVVAVRRFTKTN